MCTTDPNASGAGGAHRLRARLCRGFLDALEVPLLLAVPLVMTAMLLLGVPNAAGFMLLVVALVLLLFFAGYEAGRPALRQIMPTLVLAAIAAAGRILFASVPDLKPVSAIAIIAGATLGRRNGFMVGALAALTSNFFFGQGMWTPWQMYAWGLVGYVGGLLGRRGLLGRPLGRTCWGVLSGLVYGVLLNGYYVLGYVRPLTWQAVVAALTAGLPFDLLHGIATAGFLALIWNPWGRALRRVVAKYDLRR